MSGWVSSTGWNINLAAPGPIGSTTPSSGAFTTLNASSSVTLSSGTANGVVYLNGSKNAVSGNNLVFDGVNLGSGISPATGKKIDILIAGNNFTDYAIQTRSFDAGISNGSTTNKFLRAVDSAAAYWANVRYEAYSHIWGIGNTPSATSNMTLDGNGNLTIANGVVATAGYTVATLPTGIPTGSRAYVTDALTPTSLTAVVGGGAVVVPVFYNGSAWIVG